MPLVAERMPERSFSLYSLIARPSPPCAGVGTCRVSPKSTAGKAAGPKRASAPWALASSALRTMCGWIGTWSTRTPTASQMALATAGMTGSSGPWPTSLAPNGPCGSGSSIR